MGVEIVTKKDLQVFSMQLVDDFRTIMVQFKPSVIESIEGYKTEHVRKILVACAIACESCEASCLDA